VVSSITSLTVIPQGVSFLRLGLDHVSTRVLAGTMIHLTAAQIDGSDLSPPGWSFVTIYDDTAGSGTLATDTEVNVQIVAWSSGEVLIQFDNKTAQDWYLVNAFSNYPYLGVYAYAAHSLDATVTEQYDDAVDIRGIIALTLDLPQIQIGDDAYRMARRLVTRYGRPIPTIPQVELFGNPAREVGDLVTFTDDVETGADGAWRIQSLIHKANAGEYTQTGRLVRAPLRGRWGDGVSKWGRVVWGGQEESG
jgi:hypothetical protein